MPKYKKIPIKPAKDGSRHPIYHDDSNIVFDGMGIEIKSGQSITNGGNQTVTGTFTVTGAAAFNGGIACDTNKFTVADTSGNVATAGTLGVTGASTLTGNVSCGGTLSITGTSTLSGNVNCGGTVSITGNSTLAGYVKLDAADGADAANGLLMGVGTTADPATTATAGKVFLEFRTQTTATSGDSRCLYIRHDLNGAGVSGEAIRAFSKVTAVVATARGSHFSLDIDTANSKGVTGLGAGVDAQILVGNGAAPAGGTYAVVNSEIYSGGSSSDMGAVTELSYFRAVNGGDATGKATVDDDAFFFVLDGFTSGAAHMWYDNQGSAPANVEEWIKIKTPGGTRYLAVYNAVV